MFPAWRAAEKMLAAIPSGNQMIERAGLFGDRLSLTQPLHDTSPVLPS